MGLTTNTTPVIQDNIFKMLSAPMQSIASSNKTNISLEAKNVFVVVFFIASHIYTGNPLYFQIFAKYFVNLIVKQRGFVYRFYQRCGTLVIAKGVNSWSYHG